MASGTIFDIKRFCVHDGPGIRTTVYLKGCPMRCWWCHNPESQSSNVELAYRMTRCIRCGSCTDTCPVKAISQNGKVNIDRTKCNVCGDCAYSCNSEALEMVGYEIDEVSLVEKIVADRVFYEESGGGATFSGGEPMAQPDFLFECLKECKRQGINTVVDTCGYALFADFERIAPYVDLFLYDLKIMDDRRHVKFTGVSNSIVIENLALLTDRGAKVNLVVPVIANVNDDCDNIRDIAEYAQDLGISHISVLPYHRIGVNKYDLIGMTNPADDLESPSDERLNQIVTLLGSYGLEVMRGDR